MEHSHIIANLEQESQQMRELTKGEMKEARKAVDFFIVKEVRPLFGSDPVHNLWFSVVELAVKDFMNDERKQWSVKEFFMDSNSIPSAICNMEVLFEKLEKLDENPVFSLRRALTAKSKAEAKERQRQAKLKENQVRDALEGL